MIINKEKHSIISRRFTMTIESIKKEIDKLEKMRAEKLKELEKELEKLENEEQIEENKKLADELINIVVEEKLYQGINDNWVNNEYSECLDKIVYGGVTINGYRERKGQLFQCDLSDKQIEMVSITMNVFPNNMIKNIVKNIR